MDRTEADREEAGAGRRCSAAPAAGRGRRGRHPAGGSPPPLRRGL